MRNARSNSERMVHLTVDCNRSTEKAWLVSDGKQEVWVPRSQCELYAGNDGHYSLSIPEWLAKEKQLI